MTWREWTNVGACAFVWACLVWPVMVRCWRVLMRWVRQ